MRNTTKNIDIDMLGLKYPFISFDKIKNDYIKGEKLLSFFEFLTQLEEKSILSNKEINVTKLHSFYTSRTLYLKRFNIHEFHDIMNWLTIHKSTQLKGIASDKYLGCKYAEIKLGKNLCSQRIGVYDNIDEINFEKLAEAGNLILKISNGCHDNVHIRKNTSKEYIEKI